MTSKNSTLRTYTDTGTGCQVKARSMSEARKKLVPKIRAHYKKLGEPNPADVSKEFYEAKHEGREVEVEETEEEQEEEDTQEEGEEETQETEQKEDEGGEDTKTES